jgi:hypothetical protein
MDMPIRRMTCGWRLGCLTMAVRFGYTGDCV